MLDDLRCYATVVVYKICLSTSCSLYVLEICYHVPCVCTMCAGGTKEDGLLTDVVFYALDSRQETILWDVKPSFVIVYDPDITFVRQLEVNASSLECLRHMSICIACCDAGTGQILLLCCVAICSL